MTIQYVYSRLKAGSPTIRRIYFAGKKTSVNYVRFKLGMEKKSCSSQVYVTISPTFNYSGGSLQEFLRFTNLHRVVQIYYVFSGYRGSSTQDYRKTVTVNGHGRTESYWARIGIGKYRIGQVEFTPDRDSRPTDCNAIHHFKT